MIYQDLEKLIYSLSSAERRQFNNYAKQIGNEKYYLKLYELILNSKLQHKRSWQASFRQLYPNVSLESISNYLFKVLSDVLVQIRIDQNGWYQQHHGLMKAKLCFERSLQEKGNKELNAVFKKAVKGENYLNSYQSIRMELDALHTTDFFAVDEKYLIDRQMEAKRNLQAVNEIQEHYSLFELLNVRLANKKIVSTESSDLIFSELNLVFNKKVSRFETKKMHLLFQSFFFIHKSEYQSALKVFEELLMLFDSNPFLWNSPPYEYLSIFDGMLNSLRSTSQYDRMQYIINKIYAIFVKDYPEHFLNLVSSIATVYQLNFYVMTGSLSEAKSLIKQNGKDYHANIVDTRLKVEYYYFTALTYFLLQDYVRAKRTLIEVLNNYYTLTSLSSFRACKLLFIMAIYETDDTSYVESEIRSYKRLFQKSLKVYKIEKMVFKLIRSDPKRRGYEWRKLNLNSSQIALNKIIKDKTDVSLLKFFDYSTWLLRLLKNNS